MHWRKKIGLVLLPVAVAAWPILSLATYDPFNASSNFRVGIGTAQPSNAGLVVMTGNVGIGTTSPQTKLAIFDGNLGIGTFTADGGRLIVEGGNVGIGTTVPTSVLHVIGGVQVGNPTGADKGSGTINIAGDIYKNNTAYTNPDYVFEKHYTGQIIKFKDRPGAVDYAGLLPLEEVEAFAKVNYKLPLMAPNPHSGLFDRGDLLLGSVEEAYLYLFQFKEENDRLKEELKELKARNKEFEERLKALEKKK